uniref:Uncharacterized protein n=1 Tax=Opuntia streptacantha TaxID=393608 RepID=A0A7C8Z227_OPUST
MSVSAVEPTGVALFSFPQLNQSSKREAEVVVVPVRRRRSVTAVEGGDGRFWSAGGEDGGKELPTTAGERTGDNQKGMGSCVRDVGGVWGNRRRHCVTMVVVGLSKAAHWRALSSRNRGEKTEEVNVMGGWRGFRQGER